MKIVRILALLLCLILTLAACKQDKKKAEPTTLTTMPTTEPIAAQTEPSREPLMEDAYKVTVQDPEGNPFVGLEVQLCNDDGCISEATDGNGLAIFIAEIRDDYYVSIEKIPAGYELVEYENPFCFADGAMEMLIVLQPEEREEEMDRPVTEETTEATEPETTEATEPETTE